MRRFTLYVLFALLSVSFFSSCQKGQDVYDDTPQGNLDALWTLIDQHYCFLTYKEQQLGFRWADMHAKYSAMLNPKMSKVQLFEVLTKMVGELRDGHVNVSTSYDLGRNWSWKDDYPENLDRDLRQEYLTKECHITSGLKYTILPDNTAYVVYESFTDGVGDGNLSDMLVVLRLCNGMIFDVRGNTGGELTNVERICSRFTNERVLVGYTCHKTGTGHDDFSQPVPEYVDPSTSIRWQKPVVVLANRSCYSAANTFVRNMKELPNVTILGDQTGGGSGMPFSSELPIGWSVRFSACPSYDARMQQTEFGVAPDIVCPLDEEKAKQGIDTMIEEAKKVLNAEQ